MANRDPASMAIIKSVDEVHIARTATSGTNGQRTGKMGLSAGGESGNFFVPDRYPIYHFLLPQRLSKPVQRIAHDTVDAFNAGGGQGFDNQFGDV